MILDDDYVNEVYKRVLGSLKDCDCLDFSCLKSQIEKEVFEIQNEIHKRLKVEMENRALDAINELGEKLTLKKLKMS